MTTNWDIAISEYNDKRFMNSALVWSAARLSDEAVSLVYRSAKPSGNAGFSVILAGLEQKSPETFWRWLSLCRPLLACEALRQFCKRPSIVRVEYAIIIIEVVRIEGIPALASV